MSDPPFQEPLPPVMQMTKLLRVVRMGIDEEGRPFMVLHANHGRVRFLIVYLTSDSPGEWLFGYELYDRATRTRISYVGPHGDPELDEVSDLSGLPGIDEE